jgi:hypothetical protein
MNKCEQAREVIWEKPKSPVGVLYTPGAPSAQKTSRDAPNPGNEVVAVFRGVHIRLKILENCGKGRFAAEVLAIGQGTPAEIPDLGIEDIVAIYQSDFHHIDFDC